MYGSHLAIPSELLEVSHHSVIQQTWIGDLLGARHGVRSRDRDLSKYDTPILNDSSQTGHSVV